jgi:hypothetical protein
MKLKKKIMIEGSKTNNNKKNETKSNIKINENQMLWDEIENKIKLLKW